MLQLCRAYGMSLTDWYDTEPEIRALYLADHNVRAEEAKAAAKKAAAKKQAKR